MIRHIGAWTVLGAVTAAMLAPIGLAMPPEHGFHPPMPGQVFQVQWKPAGDGGGPWASAVLELGDPSQAATLKQVLKSGDGGPILTLVRFIPNAEFEQSVTPAPEGGRSAVQLAIEGAKQSYRRWLIADDPDRNQLISLIGTWRYMSVPDRKGRDELFEQFRHEFDRPPILELATAAGDAERLEAKEGVKHALDKAGVRMEVLKFYPHFGYDEQTKEPRNVSDARLNPAALIRLRQGAVVEDRWVFSKFPSYQKNDAAVVPCDARLDCPVEREHPSPDYVLVTTAAKETEAWLRFQGKVEAMPLEVGKPQPIPAARYTYAMERFVPAGKLEETYKPAAGRGSVTAIQVQAAVGEGRMEDTWIEAGQSRTVQTSDGPMMVTFGSPSAVQGMGGHP